MFNYYFDNSATTQTRTEVLKVMKKYYTRRYGNPSSMHKSGIVAKGSIEMAREEIASILNAQSSEIIFTGSGSEGNNTAIHSALKLNPLKKHIISSRIEHSSVFNTLEHLKSQGYDITYIPVDAFGRYNLESLKTALTDETALVTLAYANNEVGTIQDVKSIKNIVKGKKALLHLDAVQALPYEYFNLEKLGADFVTFSGHKIYAPKGIGILYVRNSVQFNPLIIGGGQEFGYRSGTENVPYIVGLAKAISLNHKEKESYNSDLLSKRNQIIEYVLNNIEGVKLTGDPIQRVSNIASFAFEGISGKKLVKQLSNYNIAVSSGSACSSSSSIPSRILHALNFDADHINGSLRISLGKYNTRREIKYLLKMLLISVDYLRNEVDSTDVNMSYISQTEFNKILKNKETFQILDVRITSLPKLKIETVKEVPIWKLKKSLKQLSKTKPTVVICNDGDIIGPQAQTILIKNGFKDVKILSGGSKGFVNYNK